MSARTLLSLLALGATVVLNGCRTPLPVADADLSAPAEWTLLAADPVTVADTNGVLPVVTDDRPENRWAALFLAETLEETCGRRPSVSVLAKGAPCSVTNALFVGGDGPPPEGDGFRVVARDGAVRFLGRADYAVFDWCERALGMRYYCTGGKCVERRQEIVVPAVAYADRPVYARRQLSGGGPWTRIAKAGNAHRGGVEVHAPRDWHADAALRAAHPAIFETGRSPMLCYGNPETLDCYKRRIDRHIAGVEDAHGIVDTQRKVVTVCQWDAPIRCTCRWCRTSYDFSGAERGRASPIIWGRFLPRLSAWLRTRHPDYQVSFLPYLNTCGVPAGLDLSSFGNCEAEVCTMPGLALLKDEACRADEEGLLRAWQRATGRKVLSWDYGCWPAERTSAPYVFGHVAQRHCREMRDVMSGTFICGGDGDPRLALSLYVWMRCLWNPELDVEAVYDGFARRMFGPAAAPMRALVALQEEGWNRPWDSRDCTWRNVFGTSYPPADVSRMRGLLREAAARARRAGDETSQRRVAWYASGFRRFLAEADALAARRPPVVRPGETNALVRAREVWHPTPWAKTTVVTRRGDGALTVVVRCEEPAASRLDFRSIDDDFVWGDDCVTVLWETAGGVREARVYRTGEVRGRNLPDGFAACVAPDATGWTVTARWTLSAAERACGAGRGNICRWRVGDRREPRARRVPGSQYEHSRLGTCFTYPDDDAAAFVTFRL